MAVIMTILLAAILIMVDAVAGQRKFDAVDKAILTVLVVFQICCELVVVVGLNLTNSQKYLSE